MARQLKREPPMLSTSNRSERSAGTRSRRLVPISLAVLLTLTFGTADAWAKGNAAAPKISEPAPSVAATRARLEEVLPFHVAAALDDDLIEYAQREAQTSGIEDFHGGDVVIIGSTGLIIVLLIVLILLLP
jgi:hypothetical protein